MKSKKESKKICLREFIPRKVICSNNKHKNYNLKIIDDGIYLTLLNY